MLTLSRNVGQRFVINGNSYLQILLIRGDDVTFTLRSPEELSISFETDKGLFQKVDAKKLELPTSLKGSSAIQFKRSLRQRFLIDDKIMVKVYYLFEAHRVGLSFEAPREITILREEIVARNKKKELVKI